MRTTLWGAFIPFKTARSREGTELRYVCCPDPDFRSVEYCITIHS